MNFTNKQFSVISSFGFHFGLIILWILSVWIFCFSQETGQIPQQQQQVYYPQQTYPNGGNSGSYNNNYSAESPFRTEVARLDASVYRDGKDPLPLMEVPRLNQGDVLKIKIVNEPINGIMPDHSNWDWTLLVAFINPSKNSDKDKSVSEEIRLKDSGWYKDYFFKVPYDSQPIIFFVSEGKLPGQNS